MRRFFELFVIDKYIYYLIIVALRVNKKSKIFKSLAYIKLKLLLGVGQLNLLNYNVSKIKNMAIKLL